MHYLPNTIPDEAADALRPAFSRTENDMVEVWIARCKKDLAQLWMRDGYWIVSEVVNGRNGLVLRLVASAGKFNNELVDEVERWGVSIGCKKVCATVRRGFMRRRPGYRITNVCVEKRLIK